MCGGSSSQTTTVETAPLSARGMEYDSLMKGMILAQLDESGYEYVGNEVTEYMDPGKATRLQGEIASLQGQYDELKAKIDSQQATGKPLGLGGVGAVAGLTVDQKQLQYLQNQINKKNEELSGMEQTTYTKYDIKKKPDPRVQDAINKYGEGSPQVKAMEDQIFQEEVQKAEGMAGVEKEYLTNLKKYVSGDMSYTPEQEAMVDKYVGPIKDIIIKNVDDLMEKYGDNEFQLKTEFGHIRDEIDKTGFDVMSALLAADIQTDKHKIDLLTVLQDVNKSTAAKFKFEQDLLFKQIDEQAAQQEAFLGLPPGSQAFALQRAKAKQDVLTQMQLSLAEQEMKGKMGIEQQAQGEKRQITLSRIALEASQGEKYEKLAEGIMGVTAEYGAKEEALLNAKGNALLELEQKKQDELKNLAYGNIPNILQIASGAKSFEQQFAGNQQAQNIAGMIPTAQQLGVEQQRQFAETTTTTETKKNPGFMDIFSDIVGTAAAGAAAVYGGVNLGGKGSSGGGGGGGVVAPAYNPVTLDLSSSLQTPSLTYSKSGA